MLTFCDVLHEAKQKKHKQTLESAQYGLEINVGVGTYDKGNHRRPKYSLEKLSSLTKVSVKYRTYLRMF